MSGKLKLAYNFGQNYNKNSESSTFYDDDATMWGTHFMGPLHSHLVLYPLPQPKTQKRRKNQLTRMHRQKREMLQTSISPLK